MRITFREDERRFWEDWLPQDLGKRHSDIKELVKHLFQTKEKTPSLKHFTPHGEEHCRAVEDNIHRLIPGLKHKELSEAEKFFLLSSSWLHDIGMLREIYHDDIETNEERIRDLHHVRSEKYIVDRYRDVGVYETEAHAFGLLARYHRRRCDISECPEFLSMPLHGTIRLRLLAAYLRLADALHIDQSRSPAKQYAISLTYNIPYRSKLHWLRSNFVLGTEIDTEAKEIIIHFKFPANEDSQNFNKEALKRILKNIYDFIIQDLNDEINSVKNVLFTSNITYFLKVTPNIHNVQFDSRFLCEIGPVFNYYHLLDNPSSSALFNLVVESVEGIVNSYSISIGNDAVENTVKESLMSFIKEIEDNILSSRKCHTGLKKLIDEIKQKITNDTMSNFRCWITERKTSLHNKRNALRASAGRYFTQYLQSIEPGRRNTIKLNQNPQYKINILLYGYSELVMKALCGFRDTILELLLLEYSENIRNAANDPDARKQYLYHKHNLEKSASSYFRIFCCEGQPKNHTAWGGRLIYHDGTRYALSLVERGFKEVHVIPDAVAPSLIAGEGQNDQYPRIDIILVGANGFDDHVFRHSAGHLMVVAASYFANSVKKNANSVKPLLILATMSDKYDKKGPSKGIEKQSQNMEIERGGWIFQNTFSGEAIRDHAFFTQDMNLQASLKGRDYKILFYNPREDNIPIEYVDVVISEKAFLLKANNTDASWIGETIANADKDNDN